MDASMLADMVHGRIDILEEEHPADNRMKCFHQGQIDAFEEVLDVIEELGDE